MGNIFARVFGTQQERNIKKLMPLVSKINGLEKKTSKLSDKALQRRMDEFRGRVKPLSVEIGQLESEILGLPEIEKEQAKIDLQEKASKAQHKLEVLHQTVETWLPERLPNLPLTRIPRKESNDV